VRSSDVSSDVDDNEMDRSGSGESSSTLVMENVSLVYLVAHSKRFDLTSSYLFVEIVRRTKRISFVVRDIRR
jgi:hypothetical protein